MAPKRKKSPSIDPQGIFSGMVVFLVETGVQSRRLQIWKQKLVQMGATTEERLSKKVTHVFAINSQALLQQLDGQLLKRFKPRVLLYQWLEDSLRSGEKVSEDQYHLLVDMEGENTKDKSLVLKLVNENTSSADELSPHNEKIKSDVKKFKSDAENKGLSEVPNSPGSSDSSPLSQTLTNPIPSSTLHSDLSLPYSPPDLNRSITEIFGKLINIYRALGDDRRSFSYYKAIPVVEKLPFKIESADQVKDLPGIGKSMQDHKIMGATGCMQIQEIVTTGKLSKLEHFETDEKVRTISLFGEVWGIGPATALKFYEKGHRTLEDLKNEDSLTHSQKLGLKYFDDIKTRIPRHEVQEMELLLQKTGEEILPGVDILCGGSYRRGKASCGDLDIVITHPDGKSHKGFLTRYVKRLKDMKFLREDLIFSTHSEEGTDSGVDTYFGLCTYPGRELRHRIDFKVYPRDIYAFGLVAWTGNDVLNRRLRLLAESKGYRLDDTGLFPATQASGGKRGARASASLRFDNEKEVFDFLGFPWLEPHERNL
ncbi:DNA polymerase lambda isoform X1 [Populus trichocarpa]|uniref:DNA polymerase n=1 Tax=Populus trichocarpa TaxID=3694 RepID=B9HVB4_POPTR|nr:DNA polymerase lambda isoform X1 [Populus trichocarpa]|eukprot:XP_024465040.1 DNA polymerase lambda isoform X1 [Populus trichocarpa]